ncbi:MAG: adenylate/guanylate cyclase domain-containing protein [Actinomycetota bacterium]
MPISVLLADDNLIVREGVRALLEMEPDLEVAGVAADYDGLLAATDSLSPQVVVTDIRMPPAFQTEGIDAAKKVRERHPDTGVVVLSQYDDPEYVISLVEGGAAGFAYLLKDRVAEGNQLARAVRAVSTSGSMLDPKIVEALVQPSWARGRLTADDENLLSMIGEGRPVEAMAAARDTTASAVSGALDRVFLKLATLASNGEEPALRRLQMLHQAIVDREEQRNTLSKLLPSGIGEEIRSGERRAGEIEKVVATILISDVRGYSSIAARNDPRIVASQLSEHRAAMNRAVEAAGGTVMHFTGDGLLAIFGAAHGGGDHADMALAAARDMHAHQEAINGRWRVEGLCPFELGIGVSTGEVATAFLGSDERREYSVVGDVVNLAKRLQELAGGGETVLSEASVTALREDVEARRLEPTRMKGRDLRVTAFLIDAEHSFLRA